VLRQRRRNLGVVAAIALGTAGLIVIITMGRDVKEDFNKDLELLGGATLIKVYFDEPRGKSSISRPQWFRSETLDNLRRVPGVSEVSLIAQKMSYGKAIVRDRQYKFPLIAVDEFFWAANSFYPSSGLFFGEEAIKNRERVCVLGADLARKILGRREVVGQWVPIDGDLYRITGLLGGLAVGERTHWAILPLSTAQDRIASMSLPSRAYVRCRTWNDVEAVAASISEVVGAQQPTDGLQVEVAWERLAQVRKVAWLIELFIYVAVLATLTLGGYGIWNIMMAAVRSRTREIGLKKAMGAEDGHILSQFLTEAMCISVGASLIGVALGWFLMEIIAAMLKARPPEALFLFCMGLGILFSVLLGVGAGLFPSIRASRMEVVSAIRYE
jgi:putative ABC transport system permease protein